ncbi:cytochrome P450 [Mycena rebaudengoi]|nr:cytochrome P450 [Mycena rebaudengoi]
MLLTLLLITGIFICLQITFAAINLSRSPLRNYPGPWLAAYTKWYRGYFDVLRDGGFLEHLKWLHKKYGPVVRIGPNEVHFSDPTVYNSIYSSQSTLTKDPAVYKAFNQDLSSFGLVDRREAKVRRDMLAPLFSRRATLQLEHVIQDKVNTLIRLILSHEGGKACNLFLAFRSATLDVITSYCFAQSFDTLNHDGFQHPLLLAVLSGVTVIWTLKYFPALYFVVDHLPGWLINHVFPEAKGYTDLVAFLSGYLDRILANPSVLGMADHESIYHHLIHPDSRKGHAVPSKKSLLHESLTLLGAGSETVGNVVTTGVFHVLSNKRIQEKLTIELEESWPDISSPKGYQELEKLPYLTAVIKESVRMAHGVVTPLPRVVGPSNVRISGYDVPVGTVVSIGVTFVHDNPQVFATPLVFSPERWMENGSRELETKYFVPFSKGPRMCLGVNLAWCELYLLFGNIFRKVDLTIYDTGPEDFVYRQHWLPVFRGRQFKAHAQARKGVIDTSAGDKI